MSLYRWMTSREPNQQAKQRHWREEYRRKFRVERREALLQRLDNILQAITDGEKTVEDYLEREDRLHNNQYPEQFQDIIDDYFAAKHYLSDEDREDITQEAFAQTCEASIEYNGLHSPLEYFQKALGFALRDFIRDRDREVLAEDFERTSDELDDVRDGRVTDPFLRPAGAPPAPHNSPRMLRLYLQQKFGEYDAELLYQLIEDQELTATEACERMGISRKAGYRIRKRAEDKIED